MSRPSINDQSRRSSGGTYSGLAATFQRRTPARLKAICDEALPDKTIGVDDNLFDVGVNSLKLVEIHEKVDQAFPGQVELTDLFEHPTIAELAKVLDEKRRNAGC